MHRARFLVPVALGAAVGAFPPAPAIAAEQVIEEIIVTARQQQETLQDVPVTVAALTEQDLDRYNITTLTDASKLVPNFQIFHGESGNGSSIRLRGIGSSSISAAFDQSVAINVDGVVVNIGRFIHNAYMDMSQIEVLKGPQSLYFGKSATAGVVSITSNDPGDEFELEVGAGYEWEYDQQYYEAVISSPITETFGARLAVGYTDSDELYKNIAPIARNEYRGEEALNARLTLLWEPSDAFRARIKYSYSKYQNDGANGHSEEHCPEGVVQPTAFPTAGLALVVLPGVDDCRLNGNTSVNDLDPLLAVGLPDGGGDGVPFLDQETDFYSLQLDWAITENLSLTSVSGYVDLDHVELDVYDYSAGVFGGQHRNVYQAASQEFRLASSFDGPLNFMVGAYYQDVEQVFQAYQYAFNLTLTPNFLNFDPATQPLSSLLGFDPTPGAVFGPDPVTGRGSDYWKFHYLDTEVMSYFVAGYWDITERLELTAGVRYTDEEKDGHIILPYFHTGAQLFGFGGFDRVDGLEFDDDNLSPEAALNYHLTDDVSVFVAYKEGFKSGGVDNSALPTNALNPNSPTFTGFDFLYYDSEEADGWEIGMKGNFLDNRLRINSTVFAYEYSDLQVQLFNSLIIQFETLNASALKTRGWEADFLYLPEIDGLSIRGNIAVTDVEYSEDFINANDQNLKGLDGAGSADVAGAIGFTYEWAAFDGWRWELSWDANYNRGYSLSAIIDPLKQEAFWLQDAALRLISTEGQYEVALIGRNLGDEIYAFAAGARPGACPNNQALIPLNCDTSVGPNQQDNMVNTSLGRQLQLLFRVRF